jgi:type IV secretory pathway VirB10-like protein
VQQKEPQNSGCKLFKRQACGRFFDSDRKGKDMLSFISTAVATIKGASLTAKIVSVAVAVTVVGGGTTAIIITSQSNDNEQSSQTTSNDTEPNKEADNKVSETEETPSTDDTESKEQSANDDTTANNPTPQNNQPQPTQPTTPTQPSTPKADYNLNDQWYIAIGESNGHKLSNECWQRFLSLPKTYEGHEQEHQSYERDCLYSSPTVTVSAFGIGRSASEAENDLGSALSRKLNSEHIDSRAGGSNGTQRLTEALCSQFNLSCSRW